VLVMTEVTFAVHCVSVPLGTEDLLRRNPASAGTSCDSCARHTTTAHLCYSGYVCPVALTAKLWKCNKC